MEIGKQQQLKKAGGYILQVFIRSIFQTWNKL